MSTHLDGNQILQGAYDEPTQSIKVLTNLAVTGVSQEILITSTNDSIAIGNTSGKLLTINPDGSINATIVEKPSTGEVVKNIYSEANSVASGLTTTLVTYTVPGSLTTSIVQRISVSGENIAKFTVFVNAVKIDTRRTFFGDSLSEYFEFTTGSSDGFALNPSDTVVVKVLHNRPSVGDFEARLQVLEIA
jgi:hypothetical protein